ncbi:MAG: type IV toxin-antitoxin system AbiEi family antitoxin domain-containing protein [Caldilineales bacterium]
MLELARSKEIFSASDAVAAGVHSAWLSRAVAEGLIERVARGRYRLAGRGATEHHTLALVASRAPTAVVCLLSALQFHRIGTQTPAEVWIAVARGAARPRMSYPPLRVARFSGKAFTEGIEVHGIEGQEVRVYALAKTIADCFKFRNRIGLDVALEALNDAWRQRRLSLADLNVYARIDRVQSVMQPYIEAVVQ